MHLQLPLLRLQPNLVFRPHRVGWQLQEEELLPGVLVAVGCREVEAGVSDEQPADGIAMFSQGRSMKAPSSRRLDPWEGLCHDYACISECGTRRSTMTPHMERPSSSR